MSRTYRLTEKGNKRTWLPPKWSDSRRDLPKYDDWFFWMTTPSWWNNMVHNRPRRRNDKNKLKRIAKGEIDWAEVTFDDKKPHIYYW